MIALLLYAETAISQSGFSWDDFRTMLMTLMTAGIITLLALVWRMRDNVRDLVRKMGDSETKDTVIHRLDTAESDIVAIKERNMGIDLVMRQYVRDMRNIGVGGGQRASDKTLQDAVELAFTDRIPDTGTR